MGFGFVFFLMVLCLAGGGVAGVLLRKKLVEDNQRNLAEQSRQIIENAIGEAEQIKNRAEQDRQAAVLQAKEETLRLKQDADREIKDGLQELKEEQRRLNRRSDEVQRESAVLEERLAALDQRQRKLEDQEGRVAAKDAELGQLVIAHRERLESLAGLTAEEAKQQLVESIESEARMESAKRLLRIEGEMKLEADRKSRSILSLAISRYAGDYVADRTVSVVPLPNEEMKGRIIGREGRNIRAIEVATGIDLIIDDTPEAVILSGFNPVRREIARQALEQLIADGRIHPARIEEVVKKVTQAVEAEIREAGEQATFDVGAHGMHSELVGLIGRLKFRTSYGQNILQHSLEVAFLCGVMAAELGLDERKAKRAGLLHDIGKAVDHEVEGSHAVIGRDLARKYGEAEDIVYAIGAHHEDQPPKSPLDVLLQSADALSGARPGARKEMLQSYVKRLENLENIANSFPGVEKSYAIQAGRDLRVMVDSQKVRDEDAILLSRDIAKAVEEQLSYPGQIRITVIRETRSVEYAK